MFSDDVAMDVRRDWRDAIVEGQDPETATQTLEAAYADAGPDDSIVFWLALATAQMETGRLLERVRDRAVAIIDEGSSVERWREEDEGLARQRAKVLERLRTKLLGPQPAAKRLRRPPAAVAFDIGDVVLVRNTESNKYALVVVVDQYIERGQTHPVVEWLLRDTKSLPGPGQGLPDRDRIAHLPVWRSKPTEDPELEPQARPFLFVVTTNERADVFGPHIGRVIEKGIDRQPSADYRDGVVWVNPDAPCITRFVSWPDLVNMLRPRP